MFCAKFRMYIGFVFLALTVGDVDSYKILVYNSKLAHSHSNFLGRIADLLVDAGHNVTSLISIINPSVAEGTHKSNKIYVQQGSETAKLFAPFPGKMQDVFGTGSFDPINAYAGRCMFGGVLAAQCRAVIEETKLIEQLKAENYDVMIMENFDMCGVALTELIQPKSFIPTASGVAFGPHLDEFGIPSAIRYNPELFLSRLNVHSIWDRVLNLYSAILTRTTFGCFRTAVNSVFREKFGPSFPSVTEISSKSAYVFVNSEPLIDFAAPTISKIIPIGGIGANEPKPLSEDWQKILSKREQNVLISFGSMAKSAFLPAQVKLSITETVKTFPNGTFIWKYEEDDEFAVSVASKIINLHLTKWMPQVDLLAHPRLSAFITHGGMGSTQETALRGVPGILVPIFGDQPRNAGMMEYNKLGKVIDKFDIFDPIKLSAVVREVIEDPIYRQNSKRISAMLHKKPFTVKEQIIKYTEFAAEFGPSKALRPQSHDMNWIEHNNLDIIFALLFFTVLTAVIALRTVKKLITTLFEAGKTKKD